MESLIATSLLLGFVLGLAHACDPDHLVAVGTLTAESKNVRQGSFLGLIWGVGHTSALVVLGSLVLNMKWTIPHHFSFVMEAIVGLIIVVLGVNLLWQSLQKVTIHTHSHRHEGTTHEHVHVHASDTRTHHHHGMRPKIKTLGVGFVHGLAGSAALSLTVMSTMPSTMLGVVYIVVFGIGSIGGMLVMSTIMSLPFRYVTDTWQHQVQCGVSLLAIGFGSYWTWGLLS